MEIYKYLLAPALLALLAACGHVPAMSALQMRAMDFTTTDAAAIRAAIRHPDSLDIKPDGAKLQIFLNLPDGTRQTETFILEKVADPAEISELKDHQMAGRRIALYRIAPGDLARATAMQEKARRRAAEGAGAKGGGLSVGADGCRNGPLPDGPLPVTTLFKSAETGTFIVLIDEMDLKALRGPNGNPVAIPEC